MKTKCWVGKEWEDLGGVGREVNMIKLQGMKFSKNV